MIVSRPKAFHSRYAELGLCKNKCSGEKSQVTLLKCHKLKYVSVGWLSASHTGMSNYYGLVIPTDYNKYVVVMYGPNCGTVKLDPSSKTHTKRKIKITVCNTCVYVCMYVCYQSVRTLALLLSFT